jgi:anti-sigma regulatory factor (Ser/Thr protein kinase)
VREDRPALSLEVPSETSFLGLVRDVVRKMAEGAGFEVATADQVALAVDEAATNVLEHAYHGAHDRVVRVEIDDRGDDFSVAVVDDGESFDPERRAALDVRHLEKERRTGGLGVHLMERIMDSVTFHSSARQNTCALVKRKRPAGAGIG